MATVSELDTMKSIDEALSGVSDPTTRDRILKWAWAKFSPTPQAVPTDSDIKDPGTGRISKKNKASKKTPRLKSSPTLVKELNLKPSGKKSFADFVKEKSPSSNAEKCVVCAYYILNELKQGPVSTNHVFTCFKSIGWRVPARLENTLAWVANQKAWLYTASMSDIKLTTHGDNLIELDLPRKKKETK